MSEFITEEDVPLGYSSEPDEYESELVLDSPVAAAAPFEIYVGNTGKVRFQQLYRLFKSHGTIENLSLWRTHNHLYHARIVYRSKDQSDKAVKLVNGRMAFNKRIRVTYVKERVDLDYPAAIRIDDISADVSEEDIFDHFQSCGGIRFVINTGYAAYIQFAHSSSVAQALELEMILNGDPYTLTRISANDTIDHIQVIENMKDIKYRKPFVMVENYPELPEGVPLCQYKSNFETVGPVRHFKIAPTDGGTVTLALCMDKAEDRNLLIDRFNDTVISGKRLKLYVVPGKARMKVIHVAKYAICKNSITVEGIPPYYKDYDVCMLFSKCGSISFLEKFGNRWIVCFDHASAVSLACSFYIFSLCQRTLVIKRLYQQTFQVGKGIQLKDPDGHPDTFTAERQASMSEKQVISYLNQIARKTNENSKENLLQSVRSASPDQSNQAKEIEGLVKTRESRKDVRVTPELQPKPSTSQSSNRLANENEFDSQSACDRQNSTKESCMFPDKFTSWLDGASIKEEQVVGYLISNKAKQIDTEVKTRGSPVDARATPDVQPKPSTSQSNKRPANGNVFDSRPKRDRQNSTKEDCTFTGEHKETDEKIKLNLLPTTRTVPLDAAANQQTVANQAKEIDTVLSTSTRFLIADHCSRFLVTINNLPKGIEENDLRELFHGYEIKNVSLFCTEDLYYPTSVAFVRFTSMEAVKENLRRHHDLYRGKRMFIQLVQHSYIGWMPEKSIMMKNLSKNITEEVIVEMLKKLTGLTVVDAIKPAHHYAYVDFANGVRVDEELLNTLRKQLACFKIDVFPLYRRLPKVLIGNRSLAIKPIGKVRAPFGAVLKGEANEADKEFGVHNAHKLFVGNIPRDTEAVDVVDYFNNYGSVIDYTPIEKKSCYLRKSAILSFVNSKHAQNAYCQQTHILEGNLLDVHLMDCPPQMQFTQNTKLLTVKFHSRYLTNDEIRNALQKVGMNFQIRFDAFDDRANYVANYNVSKSSRLLEEILNTQYINDEAVKIVEGYDPTPPTENEAQEKTGISSSQHRQQKETYLKFAVEKEKLKEDIKVLSKSINEEDIPFKSFYNDSSVQINNVSLDTTLEDIRDLFIKCGDIVDYRAMLLKQDATKICFVKFKIHLAAEFACTYNQRILNGKRILVHLASDTLLVERASSILVERLSSSTTTEQLHNVFSLIGVIKYVQKQSPFSAIVCFRDKDMLQAFKVQTIPNSESFTINPCYGEYDPRFFSKFSCQEDLIPMERIRASFKTRILPEFHQQELERKAFDSLPDDIKTRLINEVFLARKQLPNFDELSKPQQIDALKTNFQNSSQKEHFLRLTPLEQKKLVYVASNLPQDYPYEEVKDRELLPSVPKQTRKEEPANPDKVFAASPSEASKPTVDPCPSDLGSQQGMTLVTDSADWHSSLKVEPTSDLSSSNKVEPVLTDATSPLEDADSYHDAYPSDLEPLRKIEPLVMTMNTSHVPQASGPMSSYHAFPKNSGPPVQMGPRTCNMHPQGMGPRFSNMYPRQGPPQFGRGMPPPFRGPSQHPMMRPGPRPMMRPGPGPMMRPGPGPMMRPGPGPMMRHPMRMRPPMMEIPPPAGGRPPDRLMMQQRMAAMAYNGAQEPMDFGGFNGPPYFS